MTGTEPLSLVALLRLANESYVDGWRNTLTQITGHTGAALENIGLQAVIDELEITSDEAAIQTRFLGSPTIRVNGLDVETAVRHSPHFGLGCRTYVVNGERQGLPPQQWIEATIREVMANEDISA